MDSILTLILTKCNIQESEIKIWPLCRKKWPLVYRISMVYSHLALKNFIERKARVFIHLVKNRISHNLHTQSNQIACLVSPFQVGIYPKLLDFDFLYYVANPPRTLNISTRRVNPIRCTNIYIYIYSAPYCNNLQYLLI